MTTPLELPALVELAYSFFDATLIPGTARVSPPMRGLRCLRSGELHRDLAHTRHGASGDDFLLAFALGTRRPAFKIAGAKADGVVIDPDPGVARGRRAAPASHLAVNETLRAGNRPAVSFRQHMHFRQDLHSP